MVRRMNRWLLAAWAKPVACVLGMLPCAWLVAAAALDRLGPNPAEALERATGDWALRLLCITLAITPIRVMATLPALARFRRMAGLFTFFYALLHATAYAWFDMGFALDDVWADIGKRPFILVGFLALLLLCPLALTSFNRAIRLLGARRWQALHRSIYAIAVLAIVHFYWMRMGKQDFAEVAVYAAGLGALLAWRVWQAWHVRRRIHPG
jgi:sulfoxide reductase heme-binding subunit YedZ